MDYKYILVTPEELEKIDPNSYYPSPRFNRDKTMVIIQPIEPPTERFLTHDEAFAMGQTHEWQPIIEVQPDDPEEEDAELQ